MERLSKRRAGLKSVISRFSNECEVGGRSGGWASAKFDAVVAATESLAALTEDLRDLVEEEEVAACDEYLQVVCNDAARCKSRLECIIAEQKTACVAVESVDDAMFPPRDQKDESIVHPEDSVSCTLSCSSAIDFRQAAELLEEVHAFEREELTLKQKRASLELRRRCSMTAAASTAVARNSPMAVEPVLDMHALLRLLQYCKGKAFRSTECCSMADDGYDRARNILFERFGDSYCILDAWVQRVTGLRDFADDVRNCFECLSTMGALCKVVERLPQYLRSRWLRTVQQKRRAKCEPRGMMQGMRQSGLYYLEELHQMPIFVRSLSTAAQIVTQLLQQHQLLLSQRRRWMMQGMRQSGLHYLEELHQMPIIVRSLSTAAQIVTQLLQQHQLLLSQRRRLLLK
ncbi:hypothetical protein CAPTEDRAFT_190750 [Capitella teleta]|uniref:Uncharacterized protein n=1 Tax=Capitella teleta TaxID=283909 RepID=R7TKD9_CAPTE|nr:hypothetical protein CAPTEDRAFT_190750 [Capitella teleta]|eukprot:ELT92006.1 hypothetical protein CAPTEDRAFT_190750 [Capitella teleta]